MLASRLLCILALFCGVAWLSYKDWAELLNEIGKCQVESGEVEKDVSVSIFCSISHSAGSDTKLK